MGLIYVAVAFLSLLSAGRSAPLTDCVTITRPIEIKGSEQFLGKWIFSAETTSIPGSALLTRMLVDNAWVKITLAERSNTFNLFQSQKMLGNCFTLTTKMTLENNTISMVKPVPITEVLLTTGCPDCLVIKSQFSLGLSTYRGLQLLSRRNKVTAAELQEFVKQSECLNLPSPIIMDPEKGLCPEESPSQETSAIDLTNHMDGMGSEMISLIDRMAGQ